MDKKEYKIIFMGTPEFAVPSLDILVKNGYNVVAVITSTDKYGGRGGKQLLESAVKKYAMDNSIPVLQPKNLKSPAFIQELKSYNADLQVVVAFRMLPVVVWDMPADGTINLHGSLLPKYRGAAPINWAVIKGEKETGVTSFKLKHAIDTGDLLFQKKLPIGPDDDAGSIHDAMMDLGAEVVIKSVEAIISGNFTLYPQNSEEVTKAPKIFHSDCEINLEDNTIKVYNKIRGLSPYPGAWTTINDTEYKIYKAEAFLVTHDIKPGSISTDNKNFLKIYTQDGYISILELKMAGKRKMDVKTFLNGNTITLK